MHALLHAYTRIIKLNTTNALAHAQTYIHTLIHEVYSSRLYTTVYRPMSEQLCVRASEINVHACLCECDIYARMFVRVIYVHACLCECNICTRMFVRVRYICMHVCARIVGIIYTQASSYIFKCVHKCTLIYV